MTTQPFIRRATRLIVVGMAAALILAMAACTSSGTSSEPSASAGGGGGGNPVTVTISGRSFGPDITIPAGTSVVFVNHDAFGHTVTNGESGQAAPDALFDFALADGATSDPVPFDTPGTYQVTCKIHSSMHLTITVE